MRNQTDLIFALLLVVFSACTLEADELPPKESKLTTEASVLTLANNEAQAADRADEVQSGQDSVKQTRRASQNSPHIIIFEENTEGGTPSSLAPLPPGPVAQSTQSFRQTCALPRHWEVDAATGATTFAYSGLRSTDLGCRRFDGTFGGPTSWSGVCFGDVSNCNGRIVCQSHCP